jgi:hypothetical protein
MHYYLEVNDLTHEEVYLFSFRISALDFSYVWLGVFGEGKNACCVSNVGCGSCGFFVILMYVKYKSKYMQLY